MKQINQAINEIFERIQVASNNNTMTSNRVSSGFKNLDIILNGFENSDLIVIGSRPAMGKTSFIINMALNMAKSGVKVLFYTFEMKESQLALRILSSESRIESYKFNPGMLAANEWEHITNSSASLADIPLYFVCSPKRTIEAFCKEVTEAVQSTLADIVIIDYLQALSPEKKLQNRYEEVSLCTRELKHIARSLDIPVIVTSQINRNSEYSLIDRIQSRQPEMYDLRDSGTICEDGNVVLLLDRPEVRYKGYEDEAGRDIRNLVLLQVAKNHMGRTGVAKLRFYPEFSKFEDWNNQELLEVGTGICNDFSSDSEPPF